MLIHIANPPKMFNILWRDKFSKDLIQMNKKDLRMVI